MNHRETIERITIYYVDKDNERNKILLQKPNTYKELQEKLYYIMKLNAHKYILDFYIYPSGGLVWNGNFNLIRDNDVITVEANKIQKEFRDPSPKIQQSIPNKVANPESKKKGEEQKNQSKGETSTIEITKKKKKNVEKKFEKEQEKLKIQQQEKEENENQQEILLFQMQQQERQENENQQQIMQQLEREEKELKKIEKDKLQKKKKKRDEETNYPLSEKDLDFASLTPPNSQKKKVIELEEEKKLEKESQIEVEMNENDSPLLVSASPLLLISSKRKGSDFFEDKLNTEVDWEPSKDDNPPDIGACESEQEEMRIKESPAKKIIPQMKRKSKIQSNSQPSSSSSRRKERKDDYQPQNKQQSHFDKNDKHNKIKKKGDSSKSKINFPPSNPKKKKNIEEENYDEFVKEKRVRFSVRQDHDLIHTKSHDYEDLIDSSSLDDSVLNGSSYYPPLIEEDSEDSDMKELSEVSSDDLKPISRPKKRKVLELEYPSSSPSSYSREKDRNEEDLHVLHVDDVSSYASDDVSPIRETRISDFQNSSKDKSPTKFVAKKKRKTFKFTKKHLLEEIPYSSWQQLREIAKKLGVKCKGTKQTLTKNLIRRINRD